MDPVEQLAAEAAALKAKYAALDPAMVRGALTKILTGDDLKALVDKVQPLLDALPANDPLTQHIAGWLQINKSVPVLVAQLAQ